MVDSNYCALDPVGVLINGKDDNPVLLYRHEVLPNVEIFDDTHSLDSDTLEEHVSIELIDYGFVSSSDEEITVEQPIYIPDIKSEPVKKVVVPSSSLFADLDIEFRNSSDEDITVEQPVNIPELKSKPVEKVIVPSSTLFTKMDRQFSRPSLFG